MFVHTASKRGLQALALLFFAVSLLSTYGPATAGLETMTQPHLTVVASLVAIEVGALSAAFLIWPMARRLHIVGAAASTLLLATCLSVSIPNAMSFAWGKHEAASLWREKAASNYTSSAERVTEITAQLRGYDNIRTIAAIDSSRDRCRTKSCKRAHDAEAKSALERDGLVSTLTAAKAELSQAVPAQAGSSFQRMTDALFEDAEYTSRADLFAACAYVLLLHLGGPLAAVLSSCVNTPPVPVRKADTPRVSAVSAGVSGGVQAVENTQDTPKHTDAHTHARTPDTEADTHSTHTTTHDKPDTPIEAAQRHLLRLIHDADGKLESSTRRLSEVTGVNHSTVRKAVAALVAGGMVAVTATRSGTTLTLIN